MVEILFWLSFCMIAYTYLGFPLLVFLRSRFRPKSIKCEDITPTVSIIIVAHNEAAIIGKKLENLLALDYPRDRLNIIVASDGSDDRTNDIVKQYGAKGIKLLALPRQGKADALNTAGDQATGEILVFSDANSMYASDAIRALVCPFADPAIGGVAGRQCYVANKNRNVASAGERTYWNFDQLLKKWESNAGNVIAATGAIYAIRREVFEPVPGGVCDDAVMSYRVIARGYRMIFNPDAIAYEPVAPTANAEFMRKVRVCVRGLRSILVEPRLFNPFRYGFYSIQLFSHKLLRWLVVWPLLVMLVASFWLQSVNLFYSTIALIQLIFYGFALGVLLLRQRKISTAKLFKVFTLPFYFCLANAASLIAQLRVILGQRIDSWEVRRSG